MEWATRREAFSPRGLFDVGAHRIRPEMMCLGMETNNGPSSDELHGRVLYTWLRIGLNTKVLLRSGMDVGIGYNDMSAKGRIPARRDRSRCLIFRRQQKYKELASRQHGSW
jgi:hypothetical protein